MTAQHKESRRSSTVVILTIFLVHLFDLPQVRSVFENIIVGLIERPDRRSLWARELA